MTHRKGVRESGPNLKEAINLFGINVLGFLEFYQYKLKRNWLFTLESFLFANIIEYFLLFIIVIFFRFQYKRYASIRNKKSVTKILNVQLLNFIQSRQILSIYLIVMTNENNNDVALWFIIPDL